MKSKRKTQIPLIALETQSIELENILQQTVSINLKRNVFLSFFNNFISQEDQSPFRSYYVQFENYVQKLCEGIIDVNWDPKRILQLKKIVKNFSEFASTNLMKVASAEIDIRLIEAVVLSYLYVGEPGQAALFLGCNLLERDFFTEGMSEIEKALKLYLVVKNENDEILKRIEPHVNNWKHSVNYYSSDSIQVLFVDDFSNYNQTFESEGKIVTLSGLVRERSIDVEEDRILLNNSAQLEERSLYYSLHDGIAAGKQFKGLPTSVRNRHYSFQFSVSEKSAELFGNSIGAGTGLLVYTLLLNRYYRAKVSGISDSIAITGCIQQNGKITPVESSGLKGKLKAAFFSKLTRIVVPENNLEEAVRYVSSLKQQYPNRCFTVEGISSLSHLIEDKNVVEVSKIRYRQKAISLLQRKPKHIIYPALMTVVLLFIALLTFKPLQWWRDLNPVEMEIRDRLVQVQNKSGEYLWSYEFSTNLNPNHYINTSDKYQRKLFANFTEDSKNEFILGTSDIINPGFSGRLYFFSSKGELIWKYKAGKIMTYGEPYADHYRILSIYADDFLMNKEKQILINVGQWPNFPSNLTLLDKQGELLGEYWNSGRFFSFNFYDTNKDGIKEIFTGGINNEGKRAFLVILDPTNMWGSSPQEKEGEYYTQNVPKGTQKYYIRFPISPFNYAKQGDTTQDIICYDEYFIVVVGNYNMYNLQKSFNECKMYEYRFDYDFNLINFSTNDPFTTQCFEQFGKDITKSEIEKLKKVEYWNGEEWVEQVSMNKIWIKMDD